MYVNHVNHFILRLNVIFITFSVTPAIRNDFFPLSVTWTSETPLAMLTATKVTTAEEGNNVDFSQEISFHPDKYEIV